MEWVFLNLYMTGQYYSESSLRSDQLIIISKPQIKALEGYCKYFSKLQINCKLIFNFLYKRKNLLTRFSL